MDRLNSPDFTRYVQDLMTQHHVPGLAIALVQDEKVVSAGYGKASIESNKPCTPDTLFDIGSSSKSLTGAAAALLVADDEKCPDVKWESTMSSLLPEDFVMPGQGYTESVTLEDVLSHRTGMAPHNDSSLGLQSQTPDTPKSITRNLRNLPINTPLRTKYMYNNNMYTVATRLIEKKSNLSFSDFLQIHFLDPLGMDSTNLQPSIAQAKGLTDRMATGHVWNPSRNEYREFKSQSTPEAQGAGSIISSVNDYIKYIKAILNHSIPFTEPITQSLLKPRTIKDAENPQDLRPYTSPSLYCVGLETRYYRGHMIASHNGLIAGFSTLHFFLPALKFGGVIFCNAAQEGVINTLASQLIDDVLNVPESERPDWETIEMELADETGDVEQESEDIRQIIHPGITESEPQTTPLEAYTGYFWNEGYRGFTVQIKDDKLFVDARERSLGFELWFEHVFGQWGFVAHLVDCLTGEDIPIRAEFGFEGGKVVRMGLHLEASLEQLIWFDRVDGKG